jgi:hypothetical protein
MVSEVEALLALQDDDTKISELENRKRLLEPLESGSRSGGTPAA